MSRVLLILAGEGGHLAQAERFVTMLKPNSFDSVILYTDNYRKDIKGVEKCYEIQDFRKKSGFSLYQVTKHMALVFKYFVPKLMLKEVSVISFGPGATLLPALFSKVFRKRLIHIETWSRFYSKSATGYYMYRVADKFYIQNKELLILYPKAIYAGRL